MSGYCGPTPTQKALKPPPVPVDSTTGVLNLPSLPKFSATRVENGNTVEEPTMRIWSRDCAWTGAAATVTPAATITAARANLLWNTSIPFGGSSPWTAEP